MADPESRLNGDQIKSHPWILGHALPTTTDQAILTKMRDWNSGRIRNVQPKGDGDDQAVDELMDQE